MKLFLNIILWTSYGIDRTYDATFSCIYGTLYYLSIYFTRAMKIYREQKCAHFKFLPQSFLILRFRKGNCYEVCRDWIGPRDSDTWSRNNEVPNRNLLEHSIYPSTSDTQPSLLSPFVSPYYKYSSEPFASFCILDILVIATSIDQTFYPRTLSG